ncbi:Glycoside hydrolase superfamily,Glycosyl hydrolase, family 13, catalytic domain [Cinara cedri]|uniref:alpha-glucosidase n=1 Tax=Cinara cedri TaxID=506608 RepID=A0A5E4MJU0_9HEMI|nr:Glycoside hydrolase superfamily,Glycosyl hydrolase, family 13, catalytic domain [Cinara cedri]
MFKVTSFLWLFVFGCSSVSSELIYNGLSNSFEPDWWQSEIIYQIYVRSFKDSNGDGIGDLNGIREKVPYFKSIGVGAVWLSPIFLSPQNDFGYDISDYKEIDPIYGSMADFERMRDEFHKNGIKVLLDFVPNHTSDEHEWFQKSIQKVQPFTDYYVWKDPIIDQQGNRTPPNNWLGVFNSGSAWEWNEERQQYYLHQFQVKQPDLNYRNPSVGEEIKNTLLYWLGRGVDGFRFDAVNYLFERKDLADEPKSNKIGFLDTDYDSLIHTSTLDQPETYEMVGVWRQMLDSYRTSEKKTKFMMVECYSPFDKTMRYYGNQSSPGAHFPFNFMFIGTFDQQSNAPKVHNIIKSWFEGMPNGMWPNWVLGNHDNARVATRSNPLLVDGLHMIQSLLPGTQVTYYGDELGLIDTNVRWDQTVDPAGLNVGPYRYTKFSRDPVRTPFPWDSSYNAGFSNSSHLWLPLNSDYWLKNMEEESKYKSNLKTYRQLSKLRRSPVFVKGDMHLYTLSKWVFGFSRSFYDHPTYFIVVNFGSEIEVIDLLKVRDTLPLTLKVKISSINSGYITGNIIHTKFVVLRPKAALVLTTAKTNSNS